MTSRRNTGLTLIEVLVVIGVIGILVAILLPAVQQARAAMRTADCASRQRQLFLGVVQHADLHRKLVASGYWEPSATTGLRSWVVEVLPYIEQRGIADGWDRNQLWNTVANRKLGDQPIALFVCPSDETVVSGQGNLTYVLNGGIGWWQKAGDCLATLRNNGPSQAVKVLLDINGDGSVSPATGTEKDIFLQFALFTNQMEQWATIAPGMSERRLQSVIDGTSNTIMLAENLNAGYDQQHAFNWATPFATQTTFMMSGRIVTSSGGVVSFDYRLANQQGSGPAKYEAINPPVENLEGKSPRPSSRHVGGVNVTFCDGHTQFLDQNIDGSVYVALVSPAGGL